ncbi:MAG: ABC transporter ATP-binding protein [Calditrichia bacterium]
MWKIVCKQVSRQFNQRTVFEDISFQVESGSSVVLTGPNGSGKTTLIRILSRLNQPSAGQVTYLRNEQALSTEKLYPHIGLVGPYLQLYNQLTAFENYKFFARIRGLTVDVAQFKSLMKRMGLQGRELDELRTYSSGMLQRAKYVMALFHQPQVLFVDEPTANLDEKGAAIVYSIMEEQKKDKILIIATNEPEEIRFGDQQIAIAS